MATIVKVERKGQITIPAVLWKKVGLADGGLLEAKAEGGRLVLTPKADDEYTPAQRRAIDAEIAKARRGPYHGPFSVDQAVRFLKDEIKAHAGKKPKAR